MMTRPWRAHVTIATGLMVCAALPVFAANPPTCSRYDMHGLATGMSYKSVQKTMKRDGLVTVIRSTGRGEASAVTYSDAYLEFDDRVDRHGSARVVLLRVPAVLTPDTVGT